MNNTEILKELLKRDTIHVQQIFLDYIKETKQYAEYIKLTTDIAAQQYKNIEHRLIVTKANANVIQ